MTMEKVIRIKTGNIVYEMPESAVANYPHLLTALLQQGSKETPQTETQMPSSGMETEETQGYAEASEQASPRRSQRRGI